MFWVEFVSVYQFLGVGPSNRSSLASAHCGSNGGGAVGDKRPTDMGKDTDASTGIPSTAIGELPEYPGSDFLAHNAATWLENATAKLGDLKLLAVANGRDHDLI